VRREQLVLLLKGQLVIREQLEQRRKEQPETRGQLAQRLKERLVIRVRLEQRLKERLVIKEQQVLLLKELLEPKEQLEQQPKARKVKQVLKEPQDPRVLRDHNGNQPLVPQRLHPQTLMIYT
jgi:hypothetical protein